MTSRRILLLISLFAPPITLSGQNIPLPFSCPVLDAARRPAQLETLNQALVLCDAALREASVPPPEMQRFLDIVRRFDAGLHTCQPESAADHFVDAVLAAHLNGQVTAGEAAFVLTRLAYYRRQLPRVASDSSRTVELLNARRGSLLRCISFHKDQLRLDASRPASPPASAGPWSGKAAGVCHTEFKGYMFRGQYIEPASPLDQNYQVFVTWDQAHRVYIVEIGSQRIVGASAAFNYDDSCPQNVPASMKFQPGCVYKSRPDQFTMKGSVSISPDTVTLVADGEEPRLKYTAYSHKTCNLKRQ